MANETILVVDDAPVNLKLTDILLRKEGYKVHATTDAEQALSLLQSMHPDLMLVDIQLPGMSGLELTKRVKGDLRLRDIVVVALTACAMKGDDDLAFQAGCDGYITKPIETLTLARKVREYLAVRTIAQAPRPAEPKIEMNRSFPGGLVLSVSELEGVRRRFLEEGLQQSRNLLDNLDRTFDRDRAIDMVRLWVEAAHVLDYPVLAVLASDAELLLRNPNSDAISLSESLSNVMVAFVEPAEAGMNAVPDSITTVLKGKTVALVGCSPDRAERLSGALERASAKPRLLDADAHLDSSLSTYGAIVVDVRPGTLGSPWLHPKNIAKFTQPLILIGMRDEILRLHPDVLPNASDILIDGWQPEEALIRISHALSRAAFVQSAVVPKPAPLRKDSGVMLMPGDFNRDAEVLLADDDMTVRMVVRGLIQGAGIKCRMACNGTEALQMIRDCRPPAAVLDVNMPGMDGYEVLAAVRAEGIPVRIILLTARQQEADITRGFTLGADDYMVKPFNPPELLARLKRFLWQ